MKRWAKLNHYSEKNNFDKNVYYSLIFGDMQAFIFTLHFIVDGSHLIAGLQNMDIRILELINHNRIKSLDHFFIFITNIATIVTYGVPVILLIYAYIQRLFLLQRKSWLILLSLILNSAIVDAIKYIVNRPRPFITYPYIDKLIAVSTPSFPSGHSAEVFVLAISFSILFPKKKWGIIAAWLWAVIICYSRMDLGVHYPGDILGSLLISFFVAVFLNKVLIHFDFLKKSKPPGEVG